MFPRPKQSAERAAGGSSNFESQHTLWYDLENYFWGHYDVYHPAFLGWRLLAPPLLSPPLAPLQSQRCPFLYGAPGPDSCGPTGALDALQLLLRACDPPLAFNPSHLPCLVPSPTQKYRENAHVRPPSIFHPAGVPKAHPTCSAGWVSPWRRDLPTCPGPLLRVPPALQVGVPAHSGPVGAVVHPAAPETAEAAPETAPLVPLRWLDRSVGCMPLRWSLDVGSWPPLLHMPPALHVGVLAHWGPVGPAALETAQADPETALRVPLRLLDQLVGCMPPRRSLMGSCPAVLLRVGYTWALPHAAWNAQMHALHGNGSCACAPDAHLHAVVARACAHFPMPHEVRRRLPAVSPGDAAAEPPPLAVAARSLTPVMPASSPASSPPGTPRAPPLDPTCYDCGLLVRLHDGDELNPEPWDEASGCRLGGPLGARRFGRYIPAGARECPHALHSICHVRRMHRALEMATGVPMAVLMDGGAPPPRGLECEACVARCPECEDESVGRVPLCLCPAPLWVGRYCEPVAAPACTDEPVLPAATPPVHPGPFLSDVQGTPHAPTPSEGIIHRHPSGPWLRCLAGCYCWFPATRVAASFLCPQVDEDGEVIAHEWHPLCDLCLAWYGHHAPYCPHCEARPCPTCSYPHTRPCPYDCPCEGEICGGLGCPV
jgi:hypothetical protein